MPPLGLATGTSMNRPAHERHSAAMKGSPPIPHRQDGRGTGIGLLDRAHADAAWTPSRSSFLVASRPSPGRRYVPSTSTYSTVPWRHSRPANSHEASFERPWVSQVPSVTPQTHPRRMLASIFLKKGVLLCRQWEHMALLRSLSASRRSCPILRSFRLTEGKVGRRTRCVRSAPITSPSTARAAALTLSGSFPYSNVMPPLPGGSSSRPRTQS
jgi:hypothetical protein